MEELTVLSANAEEIVAVSKDGQRFRLPVDASLRNNISQKQANDIETQISPKEIQSLLRSGLSAAEVAVRTGSNVEHIARFEAPIAAELAFLLERALAVPVVTSGEETIFGDAINHRLFEQGGRVERWQAYRIDDMWVIGASCVIGSVEEDATWSFDPRKLTLVPNNESAIRISRAESKDAVLFPPLRVVSDVPANRFDSGEFEPLDESIPNVSEKPQKLSEPAETPVVDDLARFRDERNAAMSSHPSTGSIPVITPQMLEENEFQTTEDVAGRTSKMQDSVALETAPEEPAPIPTPLDEEPVIEKPFDEPTPSRSRKQRAAMPTWDEILFGTRPSDD